MGKGVQAQGFIHLELSALLPRYTDKLLLPKFFLLATGCLCGFILLGCCAAEELPAKRVWKPPTVAAQGKEIWDTDTPAVLALQI